MLNREILLWEEHDSYYVLPTGERISQERGTDLYGIQIGGKFIAMELKIGDHLPRISDFENSQIVRMNQVERFGGGALIGYVSTNGKTCTVYGYCGGNFTAALFTLDIVASKKV